MNFLKAVWDSLVGSMAMLLLNGMTKEGQILFIRSVLEDIENNLVD